ATGGAQVLLAAAAARVRRVPRDVAASGAIVVPELRAAGGRVARPVAARVILAVGERRAVELGSGQHVVAVRRVADAVDRLALLLVRGRFLDVVAAAGALRRVARRGGGALAPAGAPLAVSA